MEQQNKKLLQTGIAIGIIFLFALWITAIRSVLYQYDFSSYAGPFFLCPIVYSLYLLFNKKKFDMTILYLTSTFAYWGYVLNSRDPFLPTYKQNIIFFLAGCIFIYLINRFLPINKETINKEDELVQPAEEHKKIKRMKLTIWLLSVYVILSIIIQLYNRIA